eukprot:c21265_g1_i3 orf=570-827(+)
MAPWGKQSRGKRDFIDDGSDDEAPAKKASKKSAENDSDGIVVCELSGHRRVTVRSWKGKVFVDIREYYSKDGKELPGKKDLDGQD